ncbi:OsmC family protein [Cecembia calidifontis]|uniref:Putative redox protein n=1 Tax=Cecembia calidifontis TaxID=1187080 RepID=A0A4Q7P640_9BACT|nr:OsmC family protein [Cecembia calidifontis]RZS95451.1 putative redox protein [Cecembia calidifontis]
MARITSHIGREHFKTQIKSSTGNILLADEPIEVGGKNVGFSPSELLASALAACTSATLRMYADRKEWDLEEVKSEIELKFFREENKTVISRKLEFIGNLDQDQRQRLLAIANACPVHKILTNPIEINTIVEIEKR